MRPHYLHDLQVPWDSTQLDEKLRAAGLTPAVVTSRDVCRADGTIDRIWMQTDDPRLHGKFDDADVTPER